MLVWHTRVVSKRILDVAIWYAQGILGAACVTLDVTIKYQYFIRRGVIPDLIVCINTLFAYRIAGDFFKAFDTPASADVDCQVLINVFWKLLMIVSGTFGSNSSRSSINYKSTSFSSVSACF